MNSDACIWTSCGLSIEINCFIINSYGTESGRRGVSFSFCNLEALKNFLKEKESMKKELSKSLKLFYGVGDMGFTLMTNVETFYFNFFLTNVAQFSVATAGVISSVASLTDACLSWVYGLILNTIKLKKWGRYRSWLLLMPWIVPIIFAFQFLRISDNEMLAAVIVTAAAIISHICWNIPYVANVSMVNVAAKTPEDKVQLTATRAAWNNLSSVLFSYMGLPFATVLAGVVGEQNRFAALAFVLGLIMVAGYYAHFRMFDGYEAVEEVTVEKKEKKEKVNIFKTLNAPLVLLIIADLAKWMIKFVVAGFAVYYFTYVANNVAMQATYILAANIAGVLGAYVSKNIAKASSTRTTTIAVYLLMAALLIVAFFLRNNATIVIVLMSIVQFGYGIAYACTPALYADACVYSEWKTGRNATGFIMGLQNIPLKVAVLTKAIVITACLAAANFSADIDPATASEELKAGISVGFMIVPAAALIVGALFIIFGFRITKEKVVQYQAEIDARA